MVAGISSQLCDMQYCVLKIGHNLKFGHGVCFLWNDGLELLERKRSSVSYFNGLAIVSTMK
jgi:hypothetical protein